MEQKDLLERLERLEWTVVNINGEIRQLRKDLEGAAPAPRPTPAAPPIPPPPAPDHRPRLTATISPPPGYTFPSAEDLESLVGRYGMLGLATVTGLAAVGTFVSWAITRGLLRPEVRLSLGMLLALVLAGVGIKLRSRERSFSAALLGLALAITHVCAWSAGPANLALVPQWVALGLIVLASSALAIFAHREDDEPLWCVGFGGAAIAPFVTATDSGSVLMLTLYGAVVMLLGCWALRAREWPIAGRVLTASGALFVYALLEQPDETGSPVMALGLAILIAGAGIVPFASLYMRRGRMRMFGGLAAIAALGVADSHVLPIPDVAALAAVAGALLTWLLLLDVSAELPTGSLFDGLFGEGRGFWDWVDAAFIPLLFGFAVVNAIPGTGWREQAAASALVAVAMFAFAARRSISPLRNAAVFMACLATLFAVVRVMSPIDDWMAAALAATAVALVAARTRLPASPWVPMAIATMLLVSFAAYNSLDQRVLYAYTPFLTRESGVAAVVTVAWFVIGRLTGDGEGERGSFASLRMTAEGVAWVFAFLWVHQELSGAVSPTVSTLLLISYYALTSVVTVWVGRTRGIPPLRHLGLGFALIAAIAAARGAASLDAVWARIAGYLVTSVFLLALAWWYRRRAEPSEIAVEETATA